ncbi:glycosyltransferase family 4 protein [Rhodococcus opacus]|nr:glycosyltransferase family 4 protein [Rhodococcus opacus]
MFSGIIWATDAAVRGEDRFRTALSKRCLSRLDGIWCLSSAQLGPTSDWLGVDGSRIHYLRFGVDCDFFSYVAYPKDRPTIVSFGNDRDRDSKTLLSALDLIISRNPEVRAVVQTDSDLPMPNGVTKIDRVTHRQVHRLYGISSLALVATKNNLHASGMTVALEAMSTGRPGVVTGTPGMQDYVKDGLTGFLAEEGEPESLASAAQKIIDSPRIGEAIGLAGRRSVEASFNTTIMARRLAAIIDGVKND